MSTLQNNEIISTVATMANEKALALSLEEINRFKKEHPNELIEQDVVDIVKQHAVSELMLRMCNFKPHPEGTHGDTIDSDTLSERFNTWFATNEESRLRQMCTGNIKEELKKRAKPGDENLTFTDKFLRSVKERGRTGNTVDLLNKLNEK